MNQHDKKLGIDIKVNKTLLGMVSLISLLPLLFWMIKSVPSFAIVWIIAYFFLAIVIYKFIKKNYINFLKNLNQPFDKRWPFLWKAWCVVIGVWLTLNIPIISPSFENTFIHSRLLKLIYISSFAVLIAVIFFFLTTSLAFHRFTEVKPRLSFKVGRKMLKYSLTMIIVWLIYFLAFYPGMMSADSMDQWNQILTGQYVNHHPVFHTLFLWLLTRIYFSPVSIALAQIILLAAIAGIWFATFEILGVRKWIIWLFVFIFSFTPVNGTMVNTIWKDIPYAITVLTLTYFLFRVIWSDGSWIRKWKNSLIFGSVLSLVALFRHDGLVVAAGTLVVVFLLCFKYLKNWVIVTITFLLIVFAVRGPLYRSVNSTESTVLEESSLSLYEISAYALPESEPDLLLKSMEIYPPNWDCSVWTELSANWKETSINRSQPFADVMKNSINRLPKILLYNYRCERSLEFVVWDPYGEVRNASHVEVLVDPNPFGIVADSKLPGLRNVIASFVIKTSHDPKLNWFVWRPAFFLYILLFTTSVLILRHHNLKYILLIMPALLQAVTFTLIFAAPNFRYYYATYLMALITLPLLFSPAVKEKKGTEIISIEGEK